MGRHSPERSMVRAILGLHAVTGVTIGIACGAWIDGGKPGRAAEAPFVEERSFVSDIRTMYECIERMARDNGLTVVYTGGGGTWKSRSWKVETKERFAIVAERQKLPFLGEGRTPYILLIGTHSDRRDVSELRRIEVDPDTGELKLPDGVDQSEFKLLGIRFHFCLMNAQGQELVELHLFRNFDEKGITVTGTLKNGTGTLRRDLLNDLESKLKLASRLKAQKKSRPSTEGREARSPRGGKAVSA